MSAKMTQTRDGDEEQTNAENLADAGGKVTHRETQSSMDGRGPRGW